MLMITGYKFPNKVYVGDAYTRLQVTEWLSENVKYEDFTVSSSLIYSFKHEADLVAFKLRFGV